MDHRQIDDGYAVAGQITAEDVAAVKAAGFRSIICNRPDDEQPGQPPHAGIEAAAKAAGLGFAYVPVVGGQMTEADVEKMADALATLEGPHFAYCRSGARSTNIYGMARQLRG